MIGENVRILIVEDEMVVALSLKAVIEDLGYEVAGIAITGDEALAHINGSSPDLVIMDITLAGDLNGIETTRRIKQDHDLPVVFLTGYSDSELVSGIDNVAHNGFLRKPVDEDVLIDAINKALRRKKG